MPGTPTQIVFNLTGQDMTGAAFASAGQNIEKTKQRALNLGQSLETSLARSFKSAVSGMVVGGTIGAALGAITKSVQDAEKQMQFARAVGMTGVEYTALSEAARAAGISQEELNKRLEEFGAGKIGLDDVTAGMGRFSEVVQDASVYSRQLGIALEALGGSKGPGLLEWIKEAAQIDAGALTLIAQALAGDEESKKQLDLFFGRQMGTGPGAEKRWKDVLAILRAVGEDRERRDESNRFQRQQAEENRRYLAAYRAAGGNMQAAWDAFSRTFPLQANGMSRDAFAENVRSALAMAGDGLGILEQRARAAAKSIQEDTEWRERNQREVERRARESDEYGRKMREDFREEGRRIARSKAERFLAAEERAAEEMRRTRFSPWGGDYDTVQAAFGPRGGANQAPATEAGQQRTSEGIEELRTLFRQALDELRKSREIWQTIGST
jgi:hypothetical protein